MKTGDLVRFLYKTDRNTPGLPEQEGISSHGLGIVIKDNNDNYCSFGRKWCDVLWPSEQVTQCFKKDLEVVYE